MSGQKVGLVWEPELVVTVLECVSELSCMSFKQFDVDAFNFDLSSKLNTERQIQKM